MALTKHPIADLIARRGGLVIDGAMSTPLEAAGLNLNDTLWSAKALLECPDLVRKVHYDYYAAGANAVEACSYQATEAAFARKGIEKAEASRLIRLSGELVREAKNDALLEHPEWDPADLLTAGSIGPYGAYLANIRAPTILRARSITPFISCVLTNCSIPAWTFWQLKRSPDSMKLRRSSP